MNKSMWIGIEADRIRVEGSGPVVKESMDLGGYVPLDGLNFEAIVADGQVVGYGVIVELRAPERINSRNYAQLTASVRERMSKYGLSGPVSLVVQEIQLPATRPPAAWVH